MDGKGQLRSAWTHAVNAARWQPPGHQLADPECHPSSPSKAPTNLHLVQLQDSVNQRSCLLGKLDREIICNALACAGASMSDPLMSMVDTYYSGKLGTTALAALGANGALYSVIYFLCFTALAVLCTQAMAAANSRGDSEGCGRGFLQALAATWVVSVLLMVLLLLAPELVLSFFADAKVMPFAKTYCMIRALSLPAALTINVCQAAFRSLLDLTTPFCVVMVANAANYILDQILMFGLGWDMAGCGWASVISQYIGASLFAVIIFRRRHMFGIPEALAAAADTFADMQQASGTGRPWWLSNRNWLWVLGKNKQMAKHPHDKAIGSSEGSYSGLEVERKQSDSFRINITNPHQEQSAAGEQTVTSASVSVVTARADSLLHRAGGHSHPAGVDHSVLPDVTLTGGGVVRRLSTAADDSRMAPSIGTIGPNTQQQQQQQQRHQSPKQQRLHKQKHRHQQQQQQPADGSRGRQMSHEAAGWGGSVRKMFDYRSAGEDETDISTRAAVGKSSGHHARNRSRAAVVQPAASLDSSLTPVVSTSPNTSGTASDTSLPWDACSAVGSTGNLRRLDSVGSDSKLPRLPTSISSWQRLVMLLCILDWRGFVLRFLGMTVRGLLILSTYTSANLVVASRGATVMAAHQVVQQQQQLQMSFAWSFLHVGQSMTANVYHASSSGGGPKAARRLAERIIGWSTCSCIALGLLTYSNRWSLSGVFTQDLSVRKLVAKAAAPATVMLSLAWNNALEGCLLAAGDQPYVVTVYPWASFSGVASLGVTRMYGWGLPGVWWGLMLYYLVLLLGFAARFWLWRCKI